MGACHTIAEHCPHIASHCSDTAHTLSVVVQSLITLLNHRYQMC
ncbi:hypothetical protein PYL56_08805 [Staphylococcus succinus]|nr:hypothetical protein [Staphylococcus succinus]MDH9161470.1 hypothetical protein [Staphylococcus succinus]